MSRSDVMLAYVPQFLADARAYKETIIAQGQEFDSVEYDTNDILNQFFVETATWGLDLWDQFLALETKNYEMDERRKIIIAKLSSQPPFNRNSLLTVLSSLADGAEIVEYPDSYSFDVILKTKGSFLGPYLATISDYIESMRPAHLAYRVLIDYLHNLSMNVQFSEYPSELLAMCGTLLCDSVPGDATNGESFNDSLILTKSAWQSSLLQTVNQTLTALGEVGRKWSDGIVLSKSAFYSSPFSRCGNAIVGEGVTA